jgi:hypothetical protein
MNETENLLPETIPGEECYVQMPPQYCSLYGGAL